MNKVSKNVIWISLGVLTLVASIPAYYAHNSKKNSDIKATKLQQKAEIKATNKEQTSKAGFDVHSMVQQDREEQLRLDKCQTKIKDVLKKPLSFDHDAGTTHFGLDSKSQYHIVSFKFYARNGFNREIYSEAICFFDEDENLIDFSTYILQ